LRFHPTSEGIRLEEKSFMNLPVSMGECSRQQ
jgi:hypothetical protein